MAPYDDQLKITSDRKAYQYVDAIRSHMAASLFTPIDEVGPVYEAAGNGMARLLCGNGGGWGGWAEYCAHHQRPYEPRRVWRRDQFGAQPLTYRGGDRGFASRQNDGDRGSLQSQGDHVERRPHSPSPPNSASWTTSAKGCCMKCTAQRRPGSSPICGPLSSFKRTRASARPSPAPRSNCAMIRRTRGRR